MTRLLLGAVVLAVVLIGRVHCLASRMLGVVLLAGAAFALATPAWADETIMAADGAQVDCSASAKNLTRISLVDDGFASVQKISTGDLREDFSVVNEPVRGDIYLSVPDGFAPRVLSFFATTRKGFVYKFVCRVGDDEAVQVFVSNPAIAREQGLSDGGKPRTEPPQEQAVRLIQAMYGGELVEGFEMRQHALRPVLVGSLKVQLIAEYRGTELTGRVLRLENTGKTETALSEEVIGPRDAVAVSIGQTRLAPRQVTTAYLVTRGGR